MGKAEDYKNSFFEVLWIMKSTLSTFWFWFPIIYFAYALFQLWLMFYVHPFTLAILPLVLIIYGVRLEEKRVKLRYGLKSKRLPTHRSMGSAPEPLKQTDWEVEQSVEEYQKILKNQKKEKK
jgi:hypothetical protein